MKESKKKSFVVLNSWMKSLNMLEPKEFKNMINNLHRIDNEEDIVLNTREEEIVWSLMEYSALNHKAKWLERSLKNQENGKMGGRPGNNYEEYEYENK